MYDYQDDPDNLGQDAPTIGGTPANWWEGPPPPGYTGQWPPPLPPGAHYGTQFGTVVADDPTHPYQTYTPPSSPTTPTPPGGDAGGGGGAGGGAYQPWGQTFTPPAPLDLGGPAGLSYIPPVPTFDFTGPTAEQAENDPGYKFTRDEGERAVEQSAAGRGVLNTSGTLKNIVDYGQAAASTQYNNVYNRTYGLARAKFDPLMTQYSTLASAGQRQNELNYDEAWQRYLESYKEYQDWQNSDWTRKYQAASL